jgi:hypothetical protein
VADGTQAAIKPAGQHEHDEDETQGFTHDVAAFGAVWYPWPANQTQIP